MELELRRLEDLAESVVNDFAYMRAREEEMRDTNGNVIACNFELIIFLFSMFQNQLTLGSCISVFCLWSAYLYWQPGKYSICVGSSNQRN